MAEYTLKLAKRDVSGKKTKKLRAEGLITSVVYGVEAPILAASDYVATEKVLAQAGYHSPINLDLDGQVQLAIVKNVQLDPVSRKINNVEFQAISSDEVIEATTPVVIVDFEASEASKTYHLELTQVIEELSIKAKPAALPEKLEVNAEKLANLSDKIVLSDIQLPDGVELADKELEPDQVVASLYDPVAEAAAREAEMAKTAAETAAAGGAEAAAAGPAAEAETAEAGSADASKDAKE